MTANVVAIAGGLSRVGVPALPACRGRWWGFRFRGPCLLYDLRLSGRSMRAPRGTVGQQSAGPECPLSPRAARRAGGAVLRDPELLSLATASVIVIASVVLATF